MLRCCLCECHQEARGNYKEARQRDDFPAAVLLARVDTVNTTVPVETYDPLEAAVACRLCRDSHCAALSSLAQPKTSIVEWVDPAFPPPAEAAGDDSDGN
jgi:hypothetical protein